MNRLRRILKTCRAHATKTKLQSKAKVIVRAETRDQIVMTQWTLTASSDREEKVKTNSNEERANLVNTRVKENVNSSLSTFSKVSRSFRRESKQIVDAKTQSHR